MAAEYERQAAEAKGRRHWGPETTKPIFVSGRMKIESPRWEYARRGMKRLKNSEQPPTT
jgi:hypothetical protein